MYPCRTFSVKTSPVQRLAITNIQWISEQRATDTKNSAVKRKITQKTNKNIKTLIVKQFYISERSELLHNSNRSSEHKTIIRSRFTMKLKTFLSWQFHRQHNHLFLRSHDHLIKGKWLGTNELKETDKQTEERIPDQPEIQVSRFYGFKSRGPREEDSFSFIDSSFLVRFSPIENT